MAPMTGKITAVLVKEGEDVRAGQELVKMEAMKMEYTLREEHAGVVQKVQGVVGVIVDAEAVLIEIKNKTNEA